MTRGPPCSPTTIGNKVRRQIRKATPTRAKGRPRANKFFPAELSLSRKMPPPTDNSLRSLEILLSAADSQSMPAMEPPTLLSCDPLQVWGMDPETCQNPEASPSKRARPVPLDSVIHEVSSDAQTQELRNILATVNAMREELFLTRNQLDGVRALIDDRFNTLDFRVVKKKRTQENRCTFLSKKGAQCRGYICKETGSILCYAHHVMATASTEEARRKKLF